MTPSRLALLVLLAGALALSGCGRKDDPERPPGAIDAEPESVEPAQEDDPLLQPMPAPATPGPRLEERVDEVLDG